MHCPMVGFTTDAALYQWTENALTNTLVCGSISGSGGTDGSSHSHCV